MHPRETSYLNERVHIASGALIPEPHHSGEQASVTKCNSQALELDFDLDRLREVVRQCAQFLVPETIPKPIIVNPLEVGVPRFMQRALGRHMRELIVELADVGSSLPLRRTLGCQVPSP